MAHRRKRRSKRYGIPPTEHEVRGTREIAQAHDQAEKANHLIEVGNCGFAMQHMLTARGAVSAAQAHSTSGARLPGLSEAAHDVQKVAELFNRSCIRKDG